MNTADSRDEKPMPALLEASGLSVSVAGLTVCRQLDWCVRPGEIWGILGINGIGKTTLLNTLARLHPADQGELFLQQQPLQDYRHPEYARRVGMLFQHFTDDFPSTALEYCLNGLHVQTSRWKNLSHADTAKAQAALQKVGLAGYQQRITSTLSGGERRRLDIATLIMQDPLVWLLDEPVNHLDLHQQISMLQLLTSLARQKHGAIIAVMHDANMALRFCTHVMLMPGGAEVITGPATKLINAQQLQRLYRHPIIELRDQGRSAFLAD